MGDREQELSPAKLVSRRLTRRGLLRLGALAATLPIVAACGQSAAPAAPAKTESKPAEPAKPAAPAAGATSAPAAAKPAEAPKPAEAAKASQPAVAKAKINGRLSVLQAKDFHPDHHPFVEKKIREFAEMQGYPLDHAYTEAFAGAGNPVQKLVASVQAGDAPDVLTHTLQPSELRFLDVLEDVSDLNKDITAQYGALLTGLERRAMLDGKMWAIHHFSRAGGWWAVEKPLKDAGIDWRKDLTDYEKVREAALKASKPEQELWGWGLTPNRSGDGNTIIREPVQMWGGQITDESGQVVVLNKDPYREYAIAALDWVKDTYTNPKYAPMLPTGVQSWTDPSNNEAYLAGKIFITSNAGTMFAKAVLDKNPVADQTYLLGTIKGLGPGARGMQAVDGTRWFVIKGTRNREATDQFIKYMMATDIQNEMFRISTGYVYPAYEKGWDAKEITESKIADHVTPTWKERALDKSSVFTGDDFPGPPSPQIAALVNSNFWTDMFGEVLGGKSSADAVRSAHDRAVKVFKEFGAKGE